MENELIYIATPYLDEDKTVMRHRFKEVNKFCGNLIVAGKHFYSPISHMRPITTQTKLPRNWQYWEKFDRTMLSRCQKMYVFMQAGWSQSKGVTAKIKIAKEMNIPVEYYNMNYHHVPR